MKRKEYKSVGCAEKITFAMKYIRNFRLKEHREELLKFKRRKISNKHMNNIPSEFN